MKKFEYQDRFLSLIKNKNEQSIDISKNFIRRISSKKRQLCNSFERMLKRKNAYKTVIRNNLK